MCGFGQANDDAHVGCFIGKEAGDIVEHDRPLADVLVGYVVCDIDNVCVGVDGENYPLDGGNIGAGRSEVGRLLAADGAPTGNRRAADGPSPLASRLSGGQPIESLRPGD